MLDKFAVARALREIGLLLQVKGENPFKVRAYEAGARALEEATEDLPALVGSGRLTALRGIGDALAAKITDLHLTGRTGLLDRLHAELPPGILELSQVPDLGPKRVAALASAGVGSLAELEAACRAGHLRTLRGFGPRAEERILRGLEALARRTGDGARLLLSDALGLAARVTEHLRAGTGERARVDVAGAARRGAETVPALHLVASSPSPGQLTERLAAFPSVTEVVAGDSRGAIVRVASGARVELRAVRPQDHAAALHHLTGSTAHLARLGDIARRRGLSLSEHGLVASGDGAPAGPLSEESLYDRLGLPFIPPELREDVGEIEAALAGELPSDLIRLDDVRGLVHCHTRWSDGRATVEEMAAAAEVLGAEYLTITDHSPSAHYAGGLTADRLEAQADEIARVQERVRVKLLRGTEADITEDGALDYPDAVLERLDVVIASVHQRFKMSEAEMTRRLVRAMKLPVFKIWGHARGRLLLDREPFACRMEEVLDALAGSPGAVEVNGDPKRLELEPWALRLARERGIPIVLSVDAHSTAALGYLRYAVATARRGWVRRGEVLNALPWREFARRVRPAG